MTNLVNQIFGAWYDLLILALIVLVPVWFAKFLFEAAATIFRRRPR